MCPQMVPQPCSIFADNLNVAVPPPVTPSDLNVTGPMFSFR